MNLGCSYSCIKYNHTTRTWVSLGSQQSLSRKENYLAKKKSPLPFYSLVLFSSIFPRVYWRKPKPQELNVLPCSFVELFPCIYQAAAPSRSLSQDEFVSPSSIQSRCLTHTPSYLLIRRRSSVILHKRLLLPARESLLQMSPLVSRSFRIVNTNQYN